MTNRNKPSPIIVLFVVLVIGCTIGLCTKYAREYLKQNDVHFVNPLNVKESVYRR